MEDKDRIDLAHAEPFRLGRLDVHPALRQLVRDDGAEEVVEPRVMQVFVALARADGGILSRDDLTRCCWEGRVVGEDAINRVISRLRRAAETIGRGSFRIETITKVGYRLIRDGQTTDAPPGLSITEAHATIRRLRLDRRAMLVGAGLAVAAAGGGFAWHRWSGTSWRPPAEVASLIDQAQAATRQGTAEGNSQATGLLRRATELRPDYAQGWGMLALSYAIAAGGGSPREEPAMRLRAQQAIARAFQLDPDEPYARLAQAFLASTTNSWRRDEALARSILATRPDVAMAWGWLTRALMAVGRCREAAEFCQRGWTVGAPDPSRAYMRVVAYWAANRLDEADKAADEAASLFPTHFAVWFTRFYLLLYTGRAADALAMSAQVDQRPTGIPPDNIEMIDQVARAMLSRTPADIDRAIATNVAAAHTGAGFAENAIQFAAALGRVDTAFEVANAYFFGRGFDTGEFRFQPEQRIWTRRRNRRTSLLFLPSTAAMRADPRFDRLIEELGLTRYWAETGTLPDYRRG